jgi:thioredoxin-related protein
MRLLFSTVLLFFSTNCFARQSIHFIDGDLNKAIAESRSEHKRFFYGICFVVHSLQAHEEEVFIDSSVANFYNQHFVCVQMDMEKGDGIKWSKTFGVKSYPTFVFLDTTGKRVYQYVGQLEAADFIQEGKNALIPEKQLPYLQQQFESNPSDSDKCLSIPESSAESES